MTPQTGNQNAAQLTWMLSGCMERGGSLEMFMLDVFPFRIGRRSDRELVLQSALVSGRHAEFVPGGKSLFLRDLTSTNGTFVNGIRLTGECPVASGDRIQFADCEFVLELCESGSKNAIDDLRGTVFDLELESLWIFSQFEQLMRGGLFAAYQPIVSVDESTVFGFESLARSDVAGLERPDLMFSTARQLHQEVALSHLCRNRAMVTCAEHVRPEQPLFLNTHPAEDLFQDVLGSLTEVRNQNPDQRIAIEVHEGSITDSTQLRAFADEIAALDIELAYDDFGAGQTRLKELIEVPPDYIKFDASLITDLNVAPEPQVHMIRSLIETSQQVGALTIAEGIEHKETAAICIELGFDLLQGYLYGPPTREHLNDASATAR